MAPSSRGCSADWFHELDPPKQKPTVNTAFTAPPSLDSRCAIAAETSAAMVSCVVFSTWGMYSKASLRCACKVSGELRAVRRGQDEIALVGGRTADRRQRRPGAVTVTHSPILP